MTSHAQRSAGVFARKWAHSLPVAMPCVVIDQKHRVRVLGTASRPLATAELEIQIVSMSVSIRSLRAAVGRSRVRRKNTASEKRDALTTSRKCVVRTGRRSSSLGRKPDPGRYREDRRSADGLSQRQHRRDDDLFILV